MNSFESWLHKNLEFLVRVQDLRVSNPHSTTRICVKTVDSKERTMALWLWRQRKRTWVTSILLLQSANRSLNMVLTHSAIFPHLSFPPFFKNTLSLHLPFCTVIFVLFICNVFCWCDYISEVQNRKVFSVCFFSGHYYYSFPFLIMTENNVVLQRRQRLPKGSTPDVKYLQYTTAMAISELNRYDFDPKDRYI